ncbi:MAG: AzlC family ABC transporter permease [Oscillospiraceae bacterium]|nr:AzlC family ABC transporter permease [Oscillospiraceae bacterium]
MEQTSGWFRRGLRDGVPVGLGYFAVALTIGITAKQAGFTALQAMVASMTNLTSAGQFAAFSIIAAGGGYWEVAVMTLVANARYMLMSCSISQKLDPESPFFHRFFVAHDITDELFGLAVAVPGRLNPRYSYGSTLIATAGWSLGTFFGVLMGEFLPARIVSALSVGLFGMFLAVIMPKARESRVVGALVAVSFLLSYLASRMELLSGISSGVKTIILTVVISLAAALLFPVPGGEEADSHEG